MTDKKLIAGVGATDAQDGGLARAILDDPDGESAPFPGADAVTNMFQIITGANDDCAHHDLALSRSRNPRLQTLDSWLAPTHHTVPVPAGAR